MTRGELELIEILKRRGDIVSRSQFVAGAVEEFLEKQEKFEKIYRNLKAGAKNFVDG